MGYESKFYIIEKTDIIDSKLNKRFAQIYAMFDLCKMGYDSDTYKLLDKGINTDCYIYADDDNTKIIEDKYGKPLIEINIDDLMIALSKDNDGYRRIVPFLTFLITIKKHIHQWPGFAILHYGY